MTTPDKLRSVHESALIPRISVLMPVFNTARYLGDALNSIGAQTFTDFEFIALDDGSDDGSTGILQRFAAHEDRMRVVIRGNRGVIATRNELLLAARAQLVAWMDSDDISLPQRLALQIDAFDNDPALVCLGSAAQCIDPDGNYLNVEHYPVAHREILIEQQKGGAMRFPTTIMRRDFALRVGGFREPFKIGEDFDLLLRLSESGKMANLPDTLYLYRQHISSVCATLGPQWPIYRDHILQLALERKQYGKDRLQDGGSISIAAVANPDRKLLEWRAYLSWAEHALMNEDFSLAWKYARAAVASRPLSRPSWRAILRLFVWVGPTELIKRRVAKLASFFTSRI